MENGWLLIFLLYSIPPGQAGLACLATGNNHYAESHEYNSKQSIPA